MMLLVLILLIAAGVIGLIALIAYSPSHGVSGGGGLSSTDVMGATYELLNKDQRSAAEIIVEQNAGHKMAEDESGQSKDSDRTGYLIGRHTNGARQPFLSGNDPVRRAL